MSATREKHLSRHFLIPSPKESFCSYCGAEVQPRKQPMSVMAPENQMSSSGTGITQMDKTWPVQRAEETVTSGTVVKHSSPSVQPAKDKSTDHKSQRTACGNTCFNFSQRKRLILSIALVSEFIKFYVMKFNLLSSFSDTCFHCHLRCGRVVLRKRPGTSTRLSEQSMWTADKSCQVQKLR